MPPIGVQEGGGHQPIVLVAGQNSLGLKNVFLLHCAASESCIYAAAKNVVLRPSRFISHLRLVKSRPLNWIGKTERGRAITFRVGGSIRLRATDFFSGGE